MRVVPGSLAKTVVVGGQVPGIAAVVRTINSALLCLDDRPNAVEVCAGDRDSDAAQNTLGQSVAFEFFPGCSAVAGTIKTASCTPAIQAPRGPPSLPQCSEQDIGVAGIEHHVDAPGLGILIEHLLPGLAAILSAEDAALFVIGKGMSERRDKGDVRILRVHGEAPDGMRVGKPNKLPGLPGVDRLVNTVSTDDVAANARLSRTHINDIGVRFGNRYRPYRWRCILRLVENWFPVEAAISRLPHAAGGRAKVINVILSDDA